MEQSITETINAWARTRNQRTLLSVLAKAASAWLLIGLAAGSILKAPDLLRRVGLRWPRVLPGVHILPTIVLYGSLALVLAVAVDGALRYLRRRTRPEVLARALDEKHATSDLLATALSIEAEHKGASDRGPSDRWSADRSERGPGMTTAVLGRARAFTASIPAPIRKLRPSTAYTVAIIVLAGILGAIVLVPETVLPKGMFGDRRHAQADADEEQTPEAKLSKEEREKLKQLDQQLEELEKQKGLRDSAKRKLSQARRELDAAKKGASGSTGHLSAAEQALRDLAQDARDQGGLFDPPALQPQPLDTITKQLADAIDRGDSDTASAMADELARRAKTESDAGLKQMASSLAKALGDNASKKGNKSVDPKDLAHWRDLAGKASQHWDKGEPSAAKSKLREMVEDMAKKSPSSLDQALSGLGDIRGKQLATLNQQRGAADPSSASGAGKQPGGDPSSDPGGGSDKGSGDKSGTGKSAGNDPSGKGKDPGQGGKGAGDPSGKGKDPSAGGGSADGHDPSHHPGSPDNQGDGSGGKDQGGGPSNRAGDPRDPFTRRVPSEQVRVARRGALPGAVGAIGRYMQGGDDNGNYGDVHRKYESIAEGTMKSEAIPLTRRDYIRHYFEAVRPQ